MAKASGDSSASKQDIEVAKINARQAIAVALITTLSGVLIAGFTGYKTGQRNDADDVKQRWLIFKGISHSRQTGLDDRIRVVALVNSQAFSYPSRALWAKIGPDMSPEKFPLPQEAEDYQIRFEVILMPSNPPNSELKIVSSQESQTIPISSLSNPIMRDYRVYRIEGMMTRSINPELTIHYEIR